jgi:hypothetical protein
MLLFHRNPPSLLLPRSKQEPLSNAFAMDVGWKIRAGPSTAGSMDALETSVHDREAQQGSFQISEVFRQTQPQALQRITEAIEIHGLLRWY